MLPLCVIQTVAVLHAEQHAATVLNARHAAARDPDAGLLGVFGDASICIHGWLASRDRIPARHISLCTRHAMRMQTQKRKDFW